MITVTFDGGPMDGETQDFPVVAVMHDKADDAALAKGMYGFYSLVRTAKVIRATWRELTQPQSKPVGA